MMSARWLRQSDSEHDTTGGWYGKIERVYLRLLDWSMAHRWVIVLACVIGAGIWGWSAFGAPEERRRERPRRAHVERPATERSPVPTAYSSPHPEPAEAEPFAQAAEAQLRVQQAQVEPGVVYEAALRLREPRLERAIERSSFKALREQEDQKGFKEKSPHAQKFFREGRSGQWRDVLTPPQVDKIVSLHKEQMQRFGYWPIS